MITVDIYQNNSGRAYGFKATHHGDPIVCAAVSALSLNLVNSIEALTTLKFTCEHREQGGYLFFEIPSLKLESENENNKDALLLFKSFCLGISSIKESYPKDIKIITKQLGGTSC